MKAYLLVFDQQVSRDTMTRTIDTIKDIENWYAFFDNVICIASRKEAQSLSHQILAHLPKQRFIITEVEAQKKGGRLPKSIWAFLNRPEPVDAEADA